MMLKWHVHVRDYLRSFSQVPEKLALCFVSKLIMSDFFPSTQQLTDYFSDSFRLLARMEENYAANS